MPVLRRVIIVRQISLAEAMSVMSNPSDDPDGGERQQRIDANRNPSAVQRTAKADHFRAPHCGRGVAQQEMRRPNYGRGGEQPQAFLCFRQMSCHVLPIDRGIVPIDQAVQSLRSVQTILFPPPRRGEDEGGGGNDLNGFNCWNCVERIHLYTTSGKPAITATVTVTVKAVKCQYSVTLPMSAS